MMFKDPNQHVSKHIVITDAFYVGDFVTYSIVFLAQTFYTFEILFAIVCIKYWND
jgi:hypothetical protein